MTRKQTDCLAKPRGTYGARLQRVKIKAARRMLAAGIDLAEVQRLVGPEIADIADRREEREHDWLYQHRSPAADAR